MDKRRDLAGWYFTENVLDHEEPVEICQLCGMTGLRYHFEISDRSGEDTLWVGSECVLRFDIEVHEGGRRLSRPETKRKLEKLKNDWRRATCLLALDEVGRRTGNDILRNAHRTVLDGKKLSPRMAFVVLWQLKKYGIDHCPSYFRVATKRDKHRADLRTMPDSRLRFLWPSLTKAQRRLTGRNW